MSPLLASEPLPPSAPALSLVPSIHVCPSSGSPAAHGATGLIYFLESSHVEAIAWFRVLLLFKVCFSLRSPMLAVITSCVVHALLSLPLVQITVHLCNSRFTAFWLPLQSKHSHTSFRLCKSSYPSHPSWCFSSPFVLCS